MDYTRIPFFVDEITIWPHSARTTPRQYASVYLEREVSIKEFTDGLSCSLQRADNGDYLVTLANGDFIEGPEV